MLSVLVFSLLSLTAFIPRAYALVHGRSVHRAHELLRRGSAAQINTFLFEHNAVRRLHNATDLTWSTTYADKAAAWADKCQFQRTGGVLSNTPYGELHTAGTGIFPISTAILQFTKDALDYNPVNPITNHWTQVVWKSTTQLGCAQAQCEDLLGKHTGVATYYVCFYDPAGNVIGKEAENVQKFLL